LDDFLPPNGELLPLATDIGDYFAFNVTTVAEILDTQASTIEWFKGRNDIAKRIGGYVFRSDGLASLSIFKLVEQPSSTYVTDRFVKRVMESNLNGFNFTRLWTRDDSAVGVL
jgi:hypothetical protein